MLIDGFKDWKDWKDWKDCKDCKDRKDSSLPHNLSLVYKFETRYQNPGIYRLLVLKHPSLSAFPILKSVRLFVSLMSLMSLMRLMIPRFTSYSTRSLAPHLCHL